MSLSRERHPLGSVLARVASTRLLTLASGALATLGATHSINSRAGANTFGQITIVSTLILLIPFADLGVGAAVTNAYATETDGQRVDVLRRAIRLLTVVSLGLLLIAALLFLSGAWNTILGVSEVDLPGFSLATTLSISIFAVSLVPALSQRVLLGLGKNQLLVLLQGLTPLASCGLVFAISIAEWPYYLYCLGPSVGTLLTSALCLGVCRRRGYLPSAIFREARKRSTSRTRSILPEASSMFIIGVSLAVALQTDRVILAHAGTPVELAQYALIAQLFAPLWSLLTSVAMTLWPRFAQLRVTSNAWQDYRQLLTLSICVGGTLSVTFAVVSGPAGRILSAGTAVIPPLVSISFAALLFVQIAHLPAGMYLTRPVELRFQAICCSLMASASIVLSIFLIKSFGAAGPVIASFLAILFFQMLPCYLRVGREVSKHPETEP